MYRIGDGAGVASHSAVQCENVGVGSVPRHVVDYSVMTPPDLRS